MFGSRWMRVVLISALLPLWALPVAAADVLRVGGMGGAIALLKHLGQPFTQRTGIAIEVISGLGSSGGINAVADGVLDLSISGRLLKPAELALGLVEIAAVRTPFVLATSHPAPPGLTGRDVVAAYGTERAAWSDGVPLRIVLRPRSDSDNPVLAALAPGMDEALTKARQRGDVPIAGSDQDNADFAERLPGSLTGATYTQVTMERRNLRMVPLDGVVPTLEAFESGAYAHGRIFRLIQPQHRSPAAERFVQFLKTDEAILAMREAFCLPGNE